MEKTPTSASWDSWVGETLAVLHSLKVICYLWPISLRNNNSHHPLDSDDALQVFDKMQNLDRSSVQVEIAETTFNNWMHDTPNSGDAIVCSATGGGGEAGASAENFKKLILFSGNDYLGLSSHPNVRKAAAKAAQEHGMGPRGGTLICGYTNYHRLLESSLTDLKNKEDCLLCPTGVAANVALLTAIASMGILLAGNRIPSEDEKITIFSDELNHASIIDGIHLAERKKSHDGDYAPMVELVHLPKKHDFLLVIDDAHGTFVCGKNGGGVAEKFNCEKDVDICIGTLSKAAGCHGGFIACSKKWKVLIQSRGHSFLFSTAAPVPVIAAALAEVKVAKLETWRREAIQDRLKDFRLLTGIPVTSQIVSLILGTEEKVIQASRYLLQSGFHVTYIVPPVVPPNLCRLRVAIGAVHTREDVENLAAALSRCINFQDTHIYDSNAHAKAKL